MGGGIQVAKIGSPVLAPSHPRYLGAGHAALPQIGLTRLFGCLFPPLAPRTTDKQSGLDRFRGLTALASLSPAVIYCKKAGYSRSCSVQEQLRRLPLKSVGSRQKSEFATVTTVDFRVQAEQVREKLFFPRCVEVTVENCNIGTQATNQMIETDDCVLQQVNRDERMLYP